MRLGVRWFLPALLLTPLVSHGTVITVQLGGQRSQEAVYSAADAAVRKFAKNAAILTRTERRLRGIRVPFSLPGIVVLQAQGRSFDMPDGRGRSADLNLIFAKSGSRAFTPEYRQFLVDVFSQAKATIDAVVGPPSVGGDVKVNNYDADIGDRDAVAGGYYVPNNSSGQQEIRFPVYADSGGIKREVAAVNFIHTLLLAYVGPKLFFADAFEEGLVRAATMRIVRTPGALPTGLDQTAVEAVLDSTYEVEGFYDWYNQRALGGRQFIAPNLRSQDLPEGGSVGGLYLLRYQMSGSAWQKVLIEYPGFLSAFLAAYYSNWTKYQTAPSLVALGQTTLANLGGNSVEGRLFADWFRRQFILETATVAGVKLLVEPFPITDGLGGEDFGVFGVQAHLFQTAKSGNETLLSATVYSIFWSPEFFRFFTSAQDDRISIAAGYGAVAPNFSDQFSGDPYRVTVDIPALGEIARVYLPAGAIATVDRPDPNTFFGTVEGVPATFGNSYKLSLAWSGGSLANIPVTNMAFGANVQDLNFLGSSRVTIRLYRTAGGKDTLLFTRRLNKGPGPLAADLRVNEDASITPPGGWDTGLQLVGVTVDPFISQPAEAFGLPASSALIARYNPSRQAYDLYPNVGYPEQGEAYFVRRTKPFANELEGRAVPETPMAIYLRPGWNMVANPLLEEVAPNSLQIVTGLEFPSTFAEAAGKLLQADFFTFKPGAPDPISGLPEDGTMVPATSFIPGQGYFVRVFAPLGATLLFTPGAQGGQAKSGEQKRGWQELITLSSADEESTSILGQSPTAGRNFDRLEDGALPPLVDAGGLQMVVRGVEPMFRDIRSLGRAETYNLDLRGLRVGTRYRLSFQKLFGNLDRYTVFDSAANRTYKFTRDGSIVFDAIAPKRTIQFITDGWK